MPKIINKERMIEMKKKEKYYQIYRIHLLKCIELFFRFINLLFRNFRILLFFQHTLDIFSLYTKYQIVDKQLSPLIKVMISPEQGYHALLSFL